MPIIRLTTIIDAPIEVCFDLARSIDLHKRSTAGTNEEAVEGTTSGLIGKDEWITWRAKHFGVTQKLTSKITEFEFPVHFRDEMLRGAFKKIKHDHYFEKLSHNKTLMRDIFEFESPGWLTGKIFNRLVLTNYLKRLLIRRNQVIRETAEHGNI